MLTPEYLQLIGEGAEEIASQLHTDIINAIVERITIRLGRGDDYVLTAKDKWQIEVLQDAGFLREDIEKEVAKRTKLQLKEIRRAFEDAGVTSLDYDNEVYRAAGLSPAPLQQSPHLIRLMQRAYEATQGEWRNYTRTTADEAQKLFIEQCDRAYNLVSTGAVSYTEAVKNAVETVAADGVTITYPSGHTDTIETATLRAVRTGVSQATAEITDARMDEMDWDIILVSSHLGARVTDAEDYTNHSWWQGKFYSKSGKDPRFPPFDVCGMGNVQGIHGANCRHHHMPGDGKFNPFEDYDSEENRKQYELDQRQRALERRIRKTKRETLAAKTAMKNGDEATKAEMQKLYERKAVLLQKQNKAYNKFCEDNDLKRLQDRLHVAGWNRSQASAASAAARKWNANHPQKPKAQSANIDITENGKYKKLPYKYSQTDEYKKAMRPEYYAQRMTHKDNEILWDPSNGYIQSSGYRDINDYKRGLIPTISSKYEKTLEVLDRRTANPALKNDYVGFRKVDARYLERVLGIDTSNDMRARVVKTRLGGNRIEKIPVNSEAAQRVAEKINKLVGTQAAKIRDDSYTSISLAEDINYFTHYPVQFEIQMPSGTKGLITDNWKESEFIAKPGSAIEILGAEAYNDGEKDCIRVFGRLLQE